MQGTGHPLILRPSDWQASALLAKLLAVPTDGSPWSHLTRGPRELDERG